MRTLVLTIILLLVPSIAGAVVTYDDTILGGIHRATSSENFKTSYSNTYDQAIYRTAEDGKPEGDNFTCNGTTACGMSVRAPVLGECITRSVNTLGDVCGQLDDGFYTFFDVGAGTGCGTFTIAQCAAGTRTGKYMNIEVCSDGSCLVSSTPPGGATSTTSTLETSLAYADFLIDFSGFVILLGMLLYKLS